MKKFEKNLSTILSKSENGSKFIISTELSIPEQDLRLLSAKELIELKSAGDNLFFVIPKQKGIVYFLNKHDEKIDFIKTNLFKFSVGFVSGVLTTVIATLILRLL